MVFHCHSRVGYSFRRLIAQDVSDNLYSPLTGRAYQTIQESCAIAKMTAQCALHMGALKIVGELFPIFSWAFVPINPMNVPTKFDVRSFTRS